MDILSNNHTGYVTLSRKTIKCFCLILTIQLLFLPLSTTQAATSPWIQTDWSEGSGSSTTDQYSAISNIDATTSAGVLTLSENWTNADYKYRRAITIDADQVSGTSDLTNFPVLIDGTFSYLASTGNGGKVTNANGYDIIFASDANGSTQLDHEIENYNASTGQMTMWVNVPTIDFDEDTTIYVFYGNSGVSTSQEDASGVWSNGDVGVFHLNQDPSGSSPQIIDSTINNLDGTSAGSMTSGDLVSGKIGDAISFDGSDDAIVRENEGGARTALNDFEVPGGFTNTGITYDSSEDVLWVGNWDDGLIVKMDKDGTFLDSISTTASNIQGVAYDSSDDTLWYVDAASTTVRHINKSGTELGTISVSVTSGTNGVSYEPATDSLWVSGTGGSVVKRYDASSGSELQSLTVSANSAFDGILYDTSDGTLWLTKDHTTVYNVSTTTGATIRNFTTEVSSIEHIALDTTDDTLYINHDQGYHESIANGNRVWNYSKTDSAKEGIASIDNFTVSAWVYPTNVGGSQMILENYKTSSLFNLFIRNDGSVSTNIDTSVTAAGGQVANNNWYYLTSTYDGSTVKLYNNGSQIGSGSVSRVPLYDGDTGIGVRPYSNQFFFQGIIDEVRIASTTLSADFISTQYNNQNSTSTFYTLGNENERYASSGTLTSNIFDSNAAGSDWGTLTYVDDGVATTEVRIRTSDSVDMTGAPDFSSCDSITSGSDISSNNCVTDGERYVQYQVSLASASADTSTFQSISINFESADTDAPVISGASPSSTLVADTTNTTLSVTTDTNATCRYSTTSGTAYNSIPNTFSTTGGTSHSSTITGLSNGDSYNYYVRCKDEADNANSSDTVISFTVSEPNVVSTSGGGYFLAPSRTQQSQQKTQGELLTENNSLVTNIINAIEANDIDADILQKIDSIIARIIRVAETNSVAIEIPNSPQQASDETETDTEFTYDLEEGVIDPDVQRLQQFLNTHGFTLAPSGPGSPGEETNFFGVLTYNAVVDFQNAYKNEILTPLGLSNATGYFGAATRQKVNELIAQ